MRILATAEMQLSAEACNQSVVDRSAGRTAEPTDGAIGDAGDIDDCVYQALMTLHGEQSDVPTADFTLTGKEF